MRPPDRHLREYCPRQGEQKHRERGPEQTGPCWISTNRDRKGKSGGELCDATDGARGLMGVAQDRRRPRRVDRVPDEPKTGNAGNGQQDNHRPHPRRSDAGCPQRYAEGHRRDTECCESNRLEYSPWPNGVVAQRLLEKVQVRTEQGRYDEDDEIDNDTDERDGCPTTGEAIPQG